MKVLIAFGILLVILLSLIFALKELQVRIDEESMQDID
jgi:hypothetical protein